MTGALVRVACRPPWPWMEVAGWQETFGEIRPFFRAAEPPQPLESRIGASRTGSVTPA